MADGNKYSGYTHLHNDHLVPGADPVEHGGLGMFVKNALVERRDVWWGGGKECVVGRRKECMVGRRKGVYGGEEERSV